MTLRRLKPLLESSDTAPPTPVTRPAAVTAPAPGGQVSSEPPSSMDPPSYEPSSENSVARRGRSFSDTAPGSRSLDASFSESNATERASRDETAADPLIGLVLAERYRIVDHLGRGGMGIVYRVEHVSIGKLLAMKLLAGELSTSKEIVRRFKQEALTVSKLSCPYTVQVFDYGQWQHLTFLVMELVDGMDLGRTLRRHGPLPFARLGRLIVQVCTSLVEAHNKGIVHRDIKPENIMLVRDESGIESAKVLDFGLAKLRETSELNDVTLQGTVVGTPYYMSPEQILGEDVDGRSDIYSLGAVMFRTLTGTFPYTATTPMAMFTKHLTEPPPDIALRHPDLDVPPGVSEAVRRCMAKRREDRFQNIEELRAVLLEELDQLGVTSSETGFKDPEAEAEERPRKRRAPDEQLATRRELEAYEAKLRRTRYGVWAAGAAVLFGVLGASGWLALRPEPKFRGYEMEPNDNAGSANELPLGEGIRGTLGKRLDEKTGDHDVYLVTVAGTGPQRLALQLDALPNFGLCASLYRVGYQQATAEYCSGPVGGQTLVVPQLVVDAGEYLVVVHQDRAPLPASKTSTPVYENISDRYRLAVRAQTEIGTDVEPNDALDGAQGLTPGEELEGTLGFADDVDVVCSDRAGVRWTITDGPRRFGTVLEATPYADGSPLPLARIHGTKAEPHPTRTRMSADVNGPWSSAACEARRCCLQLRLTRDPWAEGDPAGPLPDEVRYRAKLLASK